MSCPLGGLYRLIDPPTLRSTDVTLKTGWKTCDKVYFLCTFLFICFKALNAVSEVSPWLTWILVTLWRDNDLITWSKVKDAERWHAASATERVVSIEILQQSNLNPCRLHQHILFITPRLLLMQIRTVRPTYIEFFSLCCNVFTSLQLLTLILEWHLIIKAQIGPAIFSAGGTVFHVTMPDQKLSTWWGGGFKGLDSGLTSVPLLLKSKERLAGVKDMNFSSPWWQSQTAKSTAEK